VQTRGPGSESSLTMSGRPTAGCLAHQSEAPPGWCERRDSLEQCPTTKVKGGVRGSRARAGEQSPASGFRSGEKHLDSSEVAALRGATTEASLGRVVFDGAGLQPLRRTNPATRVLGSNHEEGRSPSGESFARALSTRATATPVRRESSGVARHDVRVRVPGQHGDGTAVPFSDDDRTLVGCARAS